MAKITKIPATISRFTAAPIDAPVRRKVAAYARVSTDNEEQLTSYAAQVDHYTKYIKGREDWAFVKVYTDEGITGCNTKKREGFKQMVEDALAGKIDIAVTRLIQWNIENLLKSRLFLNKQTERSYFYTVLKIQKKQMGA